jgi:hypothetical protein
MDESVVQTSVIGNSTTSREIIISNRALVAKSRLLNTRVATTSHVRNAATNGVGSASVRIVHLEVTIVEQFFCAQVPSLAIKTSVGPLRKYLV